MIRNGKEYKVFTVLKTDVVEDFAEYCKKENKVMARELQEAIKHYLSDVVKYKKQQNFDIDDDDLPF